MPRIAKAKSKTIHGVLLSIFGRGVLLRGGSGTGKSTAALELIDRGHRLVADDAVHLTATGGELTGEAPEQFRGVIYVPGIPPIDVVRSFGERAHLESTRVDLCLEFSPRGTLDGSISDAGSYETTKFLGIPVPLIRIEALTPRLSPVLIETLVRAVFDEPSDGPVRAAAGESGPETFHI